MVTRHLGPRTRLFGTHRTCYGLSWFVVFASFAPGVIDHHTPIIIISRSSEFWENKKQIQNKKTCHQERY
jgi:hypothetical protein